MRESEFIDVVLKKSGKKKVVDGIRELLNPDDYDASVSAFCERTGMSETTARHFIRKLYPLSLTEENKRKLSQRLAKCGYNDLNDYFKKNRCLVSFSVMGSFLGMPKTTVKYHYDIFVKGLKED